MRTISVRLDDGSEARLDSLCQTLGLSQTEVVKAGLNLLQQHSTNPAALAEDLGLIGSFASCGPGRRHHQPWAGSFSAASSEAEQAAEPAAAEQTSTMSGLDAAIRRFADGSG
jgi:Arc/MetJ-type ribon-helix-helix transcriptional regulator